MSSTSQPATSQNQPSTLQPAAQQGKRERSYIIVVLAFVLIFIIIAILWLLKFPQWAIIASAVILLCGWLIRVGYLPKFSEALGFSDKSFWDWLKLLIIPAIIAGGTVWFTWEQNQNNTNIANEQQQEAALQAYLDRMADLLRNGNLATSNKGDEVRNIARAYTLTVLSQLDGDKKARVIQFLHEAHLITYKVPSDLPSTPPPDKAPGTIIDMNGADLSGADLSELDLSNINLNYANLRGTDLHGADLSGADLYGANLTNANLTNVNLTNVNLDAANLKGATGKTNPQIIKAAQSVEGTIMPDGSKHP